MGFSTVVHRSEEREMATEIVGVGGCGLGPIRRRRGGGEG